MRLLFSDCFYLISLSLDFSILNYVISSKGSSILLLMTNAPFWQEQLLLRGVLLWNPGTNSKAVINF